MFFAAPRVSNWRQSLPLRASVLLLSSWFLMPWWSALLAHAAVHWLSPADAVILASAVTPFLLILFILVGLMLRTLGWLLAYCLIFFSLSAW